MWPFHTSKCTNYNQHNKAVAGLDYIREYSLGLSSICHQLSLKKKWGFLVKKLHQQPQSIFVGLSASRGHHRIVISLLSCLFQKKATHTIGKKVLQGFEAWDSLDAARIMHANKDILVAMVTFDPHQATFPGIILNGRL